MGDRPEELTPEQLLEAVKQMKVSDLLLATLGTIAQLGYAKLDSSSLDLEQARLAIESAKALLDVLEGSVPDDALRDFRQVVANMQVAYAEAAAGPAKEPG